MWITLFKNAFNSLIKSLSFPNFMIVSFRSGPLAHLARVSLGKGPKRKVVGRRAETWSENFSAEKYL